MNVFLTLQSLQANYLQVLNGGKLQSIWKAENFTSPLPICNSVCSSTKKEKEKRKSNVRRQACDLLHLERTLWCWSFTGLSSQRRLWESELLPLPSRLTAYAAGHLEVSRCSGGQKCAADVWLTCTRTDWPWKFSYVNTEAQLMVILKGKHQGDTEEVQNTN